MVLFGLVGILYVSFPLLSWQFYFSAFASESVISPIPEKVSKTDIDGLISSSVNQLIGVDYTNAQTWFPLPSTAQSTQSVSFYTLSIPKIGVNNAVVSTKDTNLAEHMVQYNSKATPPEKGNAIIFGHSTLPQLYNPKDYKTILAKAYMLRKGDSLIVTVDNVSYMYKISSIRVVKANDMSVFESNSDDSYLTLVTCTPPGTTWERLVLQARLQVL